MICNFSAALWDYAAVLDAPTEAGENRTKIQLWL